VQLGFRGGKGVATSLGALAVYDPRIVLVMAGVFLVSFFVLRVFAASGLLAYVLAPPMLIPFGLPSDRLVASIAVAAVVLIAHGDFVRSALAVRSVAPTHRR
jgi:glycerol-3-phosphate acyltransferase PlsY